MKTLFAICALFFAAAPAAAEVEIRLSIKVILGSGDVWPSQPTANFEDGSANLNLNSEAVIRDNIRFTNDILSRHGTCWKFVLRDNAIYTLSGFANNWFIGNPRSDAFREGLEDNATMNANSRTTWKWHDDSLNIYINNSTSGSCTFPGNRTAITLGAGAYTTLIIHEVGHFLGLRHTHPTMDDNDTDASVDDWGNGDASDETLDDDKDAAPAQILTRYNGIFPQSAIDDLTFNLMSYHMPQDRFVWDQREALITHFNTTRAFCTTGRARFVEPGGDDLGEGFSVTGRLATIGRAVDLSISPNDVVLIRAGTHNANAHGLPLTITRPLTLGAWRGPVTITR